MKSSALEMIVEVHWKFRLDIKSAVNPAPVVSFLPFRDKHGIRELTSDVKYAC